MADISTATPIGHRSARAPMADRILGALALVLLAFVLVALWRGRAQWDLLPAPVWIHLATMIPALALTPAMLGRAKGDRRHRALGYAWVALMAATAIASLFVRLSRPGHFSFIHILSVWVLLMLVLLVRAARAHDVKAHRARVRGLVIGALLVAGAFTFPFGRLLGTWLQGHAFLRQS